MSKNKYVDFVSDEHFIKCIKHVCDAYDSDPKASWNNGRDPFKLIFDIMNNSSNFSDWENREAMRQADKTINNRIGEFHQKLLGGVDGWTDLGTGDETKLDLKKNDNTIFLELKNKFNTVNSDSSKAVWEKLEKNLESYPASTNYLAFLIEKNGTSGEKIWKYKTKSISNIKKIWGYNVYALVTNKDDALKKTWDAMPIAINKIVEKKSDLTEDYDLLLAHFQNAFYL